MPICAGLTVMLADWGHTTLAAANGEWALRLAAQEDWRFDAIFADHQVGAGPKGVETAKEIARRAGGALPTMIVTGDIAKDRIAGIHASGFVMLRAPGGGRGFAPASGDGVGGVGSPYEVRRRRMTGISAKSPIYTIE